MTVSELLAWSDDDIAAAITSRRNEVEACSGCGLRPDQMHLVGFELDRCPGCEALQRHQHRIADPDTPRDYGVRAVATAVDDTRQSVWAQFTHAGRKFLHEHRRRTDPIRLPRRPDL